MPDNTLWYYGPWTLWVMAGRGVASGARLWQVIALRRTSVAITAAGLVSGAGWELVRLRNTSHNSHSGTNSQSPRDRRWIDHDFAQPHTAVATQRRSGTGSFSRANMVDYLGLRSSRGH